MTPCNRLTALAAACLALAAPVSAQETADRIWSGGPILTMNDAAMHAEAVAEKGGKIVAVGTAAEVMKLKGSGTQVIDLAGRAMLPGFVDAHGHMFVGGVQALSANLLAPPDGDVRDIASLQQVVRDWMAANDAAVKKVGLILGFGSATTTPRSRSTATPTATTSTRSPRTFRYCCGTSRATWWR